jgi:uncharacterized protein YlxW (UPF0749 family)
MSEYAKNRSRVQGLQITLAIVMLFFGILLTAQIRTQVKATNSIENQNSQDLSMIIITLNEKREDLNKNLASLEEELENLGNKANDGISLNATLDNQIKQLNMITGNSAVEGPGISVTITGDSPLFYLDIIDLVNELFSSGAEAVAVNDIRVHLRTMIYEGPNAKGDYIITIDGKEAFFPVIIKAVGNADTLEKGLTYPGGRIDFFNNFYHIFPTIKKEQQINIPPSESKPRHYVRYN